MDATQWAGIIAFGAASILSLWIRQQPWNVIGILNMVMAIECGLGMRHRAHNVAIELIGPFYLDRVGLQIALIIALATIVFLTVWLLLKRKYRRAPASIIAATGLAVALFSVEIISLHVIDALLYRKAASLLVIGWIWAGIGSVIAIEAIREIYRKANSNT